MLINALYLLLLSYKCYTSNKMHKCSGGSQHLAFFFHLPVPGMHIDPPTHHHVVLCKQTKNDLDVFATNVLKYIWSNDKPLIWGVKGFIINFDDTNRYII